MKTELRACKTCNKILQEKKCLTCNDDTSTKWKGLIAIIDHSKSEVSREMNITENGEYALKVR